jgi:hypothetical protein
MGIIARTYKKMRIDLARRMQSEDRGLSGRLDIHLCSRSTKKIRLGLARRMQSEDRGLSGRLDRHLCSRSTKKIRLGLARSMQPEDRRPGQTWIPPYPPGIGTRCATDRRSIARAHSEYAVGPGRGTGRDLAPGPGILLHYSGGAKSLSGF